MVETLLATLISIGILGTPVNAEVSAYSPFDNVSGICADSNPNRTATGQKPGPEIIAVDPREIPYGTLVFIPGHGYAIAGDTGGALRKNKNIAIDIYKDTHKQAIVWGRRKMQIIVFRGVANDIQ